MTNLLVRDTYKTISRSKTHLVQSKEIATTCVCPYLFKMSYPFGVVGGERDYLVANTVHDVAERNVGAAGTLQDVNVAISRAKEKLIILGNFNMMLNGWTSSSARYHYKSPTRNLARLVDSRYGKVIDVPRILVH